MQLGKNREPETEASGTESELLDLRAALLSLTSTRKQYLHRYAAELANQNLQIMALLCLAGLVAEAGCSLCARLMTGTWHFGLWGWGLAGVFLAFFALAALTPKRLCTNRYYAALVVAGFTAATLLFTVGQQLQPGQPYAGALLALVYLVLGTMLVQPTGITMPLMLAAEAAFLAGLALQEGQAAYPAGILSLLGLFAAGVCGFVLAAVNLQNGSRLRRFRTLSRMDGLTGLLNKGSAEAAAAAYLASRDENEPCAMLVIDVDNFKNVNDTSGHAQGDKVLARVSEAICNSFRGSDIIGRIGGDEFLVLAKNIRDQAAVQKRCESLHTAVAEIEATAGNISCSIGAAWLKAGRIDYDELFQTADAAVYVAKATGKGRDELREVVGRGRRPMMLIVDDEQVTRRMLRNGFNEEFSVIEAPNGRRALDLVETYGRRISVILLDIRMPEIDGYQVLAEIRKRYTARKMPVLVVTSDAESERRALSLGANDVITKPFDHDIVRMRIRIARGQTETGR